MLRRSLGSFLLLVPTLRLLEIAGRLADGQRDGWGWFLLSGLVLCGASANLWSGEPRDRQVVPGKGRPMPDRWDLE